MAKCKDCFHYEACCDFSKIIDAAMNVETGCEYFVSREEVTPVVRCKECKQWNCVTKPKMCDKRHGYCLNDDEPIGRREDDFCSYGERKDK